MAKILKHGNTYHDTGALTCTSCGCEFQPEIPIDEMRCPECGITLIEQKDQTTPVIKERELGPVRNYPGYGAERDFGNPWDD